MNLYIVRHAAALPPDGDSGSASDTERPLSPRGRERFTGVVRALDRIGVRLARVEHSPLVRAVQTAELLAPLSDGPRTANPALAEPPDDRLLASLAGAHDGTALVGHDPHVSELVALLCFRDARAGAGLRFSKGAVAWLDGEPKRGGMRLRAFWPPKSLLALLPEGD